MLCRKISTEFSTTVEKPHPAFIFGGSVEILALSIMNFKKNFKKILKKNFSEKEKIKTDLQS